MVARGAQIARLHFPPVTQLQVYIRLVGIQGVGVKGFPPVDIDAQVAYPRGADRLYCADFVLIRYRNPPPLFRIVLLDPHMRLEEDPGQIEVVCAGMNL